MFAAHVWQRTSQLAMRLLKLKANHKHTLEKYKSPPANMQQASMLCIASWERTPLIVPGAESQRPQAPHKKGCYVCLDEPTPP